MQIDFSRPSLYNWLIDYICNFVLFSAQWATLSVFPKNQNDQNS